MDKKNIFGLILIVLVAVVIAAGYVLYKMYSPKYNWGETLNSNSNEPYDCSQIKYLLKKSADKDKFIELNKSIENLKLSEGVYTLVSVGSYQYINDIDAEELLGFVEKGNTYFIATNNLPPQLLYSIDSTFVLSDYIFSNLDSIARVRLSEDQDRQFNFIYNYKKKTEQYSWSVFSDSIHLSSLDFKNLGNLNGEDYFLQYNYGKGKIIFHLNPIILTNYFLSKKEGFDYANRVFKSLNTDYIIWDEFYKQNHEENVVKNRQSSPLKFLLSHKSFAWAYYILIVLIVLFFLFKAKRQQRIIPYILPLRNTSIEYAKTIGRFYYGQVEYHSIANNMIFLFDNFIHKRYNIPRNIKEEERILLLIKRSDIDETTIRKIFSVAALAKLKFNKEADYLWNLNNVLEYFYKNCK